MSTYRFRLLRVKTNWFAAFALLYLFEMVFASPAHAKLIQMSWSGYLGSVPFIDEQDGGNTISGSFVYDTDSPLIALTPDSALYDTNHQTDVFINRIYTFASTGTIGLTNDAPACGSAPICIPTDSIQFTSTSFSGTPFGGVGIRELQLFMGNIGGSSISDTGLPISDPGINSVIGGSVYFGTDVDPVSFNLIEYSYSEFAGVSIVSTLSLVLAAMASMALQRRRLR
ncbi:MAG: hypothetical protein AAGA91_13730 [Pseudomonadota bacterium]